MFEARAGPLPEDQVRKGIICQVPFAAARCSTSLGPVSATSAEQITSQLSAFKQALYFAFTQIWGARNLARTWLCRFHLGPFT